MRFSFGSESTGSYFEFEIPFHLIQYSKKFRDYSDSQDIEVPFEFTGKDIDDTIRLLEIIY